MKCKLFLLASCLVFSCISCNNDDKKPSPESGNDINAVTDFIRAALDGKFEEARKLLLSDSLNINYLDVNERSYQKLDPDTRNGYRESSIHIHQVTPVNDSTTIIIFSNSFKNDHDTLKALKVSGQWLIDLKYLYQHDMDTMHYMNSNKDSLK
jgi:hypothetical protein